MLQSLASAAPAAKDSSGESGRIAIEAALAQVQTVFSAVRADAEGSRQDAEAALLNLDRLDEALEQRQKWLQSKEAALKRLQQPGNSLQVSAVQGRCARFADFYDWDDQAVDIWGWVNRRVVRLELDN